MRKLLGYRLIRGATPPRSVHIEGTVLLVEEGRDVGDCVERLPHLDTEVSEGPTLGRRPALPPRFVPRGAPKLRLKELFQQKWTEESTKEFHLLAVEVIDRACSMAEQVATGGMPRPIGMPMPEAVLLDRVSKMEKAQEFLDWFRGK